MAEKKQEKVEKMAPQINLGGEIIGTITLGITKNLKVSQVTIKGRGGMVKRGAVRQALPLIDRAILMGRRSEVALSRNIDEEALAKKRKEAAERAAKEAAIAEEKRKKEAEELAALKAKNIEERKKKEAEQAAFITEQSNKRK